MKREREKTIRLVIIAITVIAIVAIIANHSSQEFIDQPEKVVENEFSETADEPWWAWLMTIGIIAFEVGRFAWIIQQEKKGYSFSIKTDE